MKNQKKNLNFAIITIAFAAFCAGSALLYSHKLQSKNSQKPTTSSVSKVASADDISVSKLQFVKQDMLRDNDENSAAWLKNIRECRQQKNIKHLYDDYQNVGVFEVMENVRYNSLYAIYKLKLVKSIKSSNHLQAGNTIYAFTHHTPNRSNYPNSSIYKSSALTPLMRKNQRYLLIYGDPAKNNTRKQLISHGEKPGDYYALNYGTLIDTKLRLSKEQNLTTIQSGKTYAASDLATFDLFCESKTILQEWYRTKDAILTYYIGKDYDKQF